MTTVTTIPSGGADPTAPTPRPWRRSSLLPPLWHTLLLLVTVRSGFGVAALPVGRETPRPAVPTGGSPAVNLDADRVFVVFGNHLDLGYDVAFSGPNFGYTSGIINDYLNEYIPRAVETARRFAANKSDVAAGRSYTWMGFSFLFDVLLNCRRTVVNVAPGTPSNLTCPGPAAVAAIEAAMAAGPSAGLTWPAFPHNAEPEMLTPGLFKAAVDMSNRLADRFGRPHRITYSQRDVPGLTRAAVPLLARLGVRAISVGENTCPRPLAFFPGDEAEQWPTKIFRWLDRPSNTSVIAMFHPHGYGGIGPNDCVYVAGARAAVCTAWKMDNVGPHSYADASQIFDTVQAQFPNARVAASDGFDDFVRAVLPFEHTLPTLTHEIGDSWIYGASADPVKVSSYRAAARARSACIAAGRWEPDGGAERDFDRLLLKPSEHTWGSSGGDCKSLPFDQPLSELGAFPIKAGAAATPQFDPMCVNTWYEQRQFVVNAAIALIDGGSACARTMQDALNGISKRWRDGIWPIEKHISTKQTLKHYQPVLRSAAGTFTAKTAAGLSLTFDGAGGIVGLGMAGAAGPRAARSASSWVGPAAPLALYSYQVVSGGDMQRWVTAYGAMASPDYSNFATGGQEATSGGSIGATGYSAVGTLEAVWLRDRTVRTDAKAADIILNLSLPARAWKEAGAPEQVTIRYQVEADHAASVFVVDITLQTIGKQPTKHKEAGWLSFQPPYPAGTKLELDKLGSWIDPTDVLPFNGSNMHLHACDTGARWSTTGHRGGLRLETIDTALVSVGSRNPAPTSAVDGAAPYPGSGPRGLVPDPAGGLHVSLHNNLWNTNYPFWYPWQREDQDTQYRFRLSVPFDEAPIGSSQ